MTLESKLLLISSGREDSRAHRLAIAIVEYAWDRGAEVRVRRDSEAWTHSWATAGHEERLAEVTSEDLEWADVTIVLADSARDSAEWRASGPRLVS
jgi:hypothetical protein